MFDSVFNSSSTNTHIDVCVFVLVYLWGPTHDRQLCGDPVLHIINFQGEGMFDRPSFTPGI